MLKAGPDSEQRDKNTRMITAAGNSEPSKTPSNCECDDTHFHRRRNAFCDDMGELRREDMELKNYMEDLVMQQIDAVISANRDVCSCEKCRYDIAAIALTILPPIM